MNLGVLLARHARYRPDHVAVVFDDQRLTYREFNRLANGLTGLGILHAGALVFSST
jgi:non-ribosomal peptide synthetase component E (peptide arylation enzyme)